MRIHKMVIVDDETDTRDALSHYFPWDQLGFEVVGLFENGKQALESIKIDPPHVVFSDIRMPIMTGIQLAEELFHLHSKVKIIFLSAFADFEVAKQALVYGVKDYILKPAKYKELIEVFSRIKDELESVSTDNETEYGEIKEYNYDEEVIATIKMYLEKNYRNASLREASALVRMNPSYLSQFIKLKTGENFSQCLMRVRMRKASDQLRDISNKVYDVSDNVGYSNPKNFSRSFKSYFGKTPMEFRRGSSNEC